MEGWWSGGGGGHKKKDDDDDYTRLPQDIEIVIHQAKSDEELKKDFIYHFYDRLRTLYGQDVIRNHFFTEMVSFDGYYWMRDTHEVAKVLRNNDVRYVARVTVAGETSAIELYLASDVGECVDSLIELCEEYKLNVNKKENNKHD
jgi:hypothetical protein